MQEASIKIDVRGMERVADRPKKVSQGLEGVNKGDYAEVVADDERMLQLAPRIIESIGKARFIKSWKGEDGYFYTLVQKV